MTARPNILLVLPDQLRGDWVGFRQHEPVRTPHLDRLARRGVAFTRAWTPSPLCATARACFATACEFDRSPVKRNADNVSADTPTIYHYLKQAGYRVATAGKLDLLKGAMDWGADGRHMVDGTVRLFDLGFTDGVDNAGKHDAIRGHERQLEEPYFQYLRANGLDAIHAADFCRREPPELAAPIGEVMANAPPPPIAYANTDLSPLPDHAYCDNWIGRNATGLLSELVDGGKPWFLTVNFAGPHEPMDVTASMRGRWENIAFSKPHGRPGTDAPLQQTIRQNYAAMIELIDHWLGEMIALLDGKGATENTLIVFASDHGEMLGDYNLWGKQVPFEPSVNVPLVMAGPMVSASGLQSAGPASLIDVAETFLDVAGAVAHGRRDGRSLAPILAGKTAAIRPYAFSGLGEWRAVSNGRHKLVAGFETNRPQIAMQLGVFSGGSAESRLALYDLDADPWDANNIAESEPSVVQDLWRALLENSRAAAA